MSRPLPRPASLHPSDLVRLGAHGLRSHPLRLVLSALGIAIGVAAMIAVVGISVSSKAEINDRIDRLGTDLLRVSPGQDLQGEQSPLPVESVRMVSRIGPVYAVGATGTLHANVYRNDHIPTGRTASIAVLAAEPRMLATVGGSMRVGSWFNGATERVPTVVLGWAAAQRLATFTPGVRLWLGGQWFGLVGVLNPVPLAPEIDSAALVGWASARTYLGFDSHPSTIYLRAAESQVAAVRSVLATTANPRSPGEVSISRPSDALVARAYTNSALTGLLLGLGAVALLVGGLGVGNTMIVSVLERRSEIGLRRALGATRQQIRGQFLAESLLLSAIGGGAGTVLGVAITAGYAIVRGWHIETPPWVTLAGFAVTLVIGAVAGLYPAVRASRLAPTQALATP